MGIWLWGREYGVWGGVVEGESEGAGYVGRVMKVVGVEKRQG